MGSGVVTYHCKLSTLLCSSAGRLFFVTLVNALRQLLQYVSTLAELARPSARRRHTAFVSCITYSFQSPDPGRISPLQKHFWEL